MEEKVLLDVELNAKKALESYAKIKIRIDELRDSQKKLKDSGLENSQVYIETEQQIKALNKRAQEYQKTIQQNVKLEHEQQGSLQQLKAQLSLWTQEYNKLSEVERNSPAGQQMAKNIGEVTKRLTDAEVELGDFHRQVGNYELASKALKKEMAQLADQLLAMKINQQEGTEEYRRTAERLAELKDAVADVAEEIKGLADDTKSLSIASQSLGFLSTNLNTMKQITEELNIGVPLLQESINKLNLVTTALSIATQLQTAAQNSNRQIQTCTDNANRVIAKLDAIEDSRKDREIASLTAALTAANSRAERAAELAPILKQLNDIACKQPQTVTVPYSPGVLVPNCVAWNSALYGGIYPFANGGQFG